MILFERSYAPTLAGLAEDLSAKTVETWTFDDAATRRAAEATFAARGVTARCHSAYKPLVTAFRDRIETNGLTEVQITYPRHPGAGARRFLLESYPLSAMLPDVRFTFQEGAETDSLPAYHLRLTYAEGRVEEESLHAPNRLHADYAGNEVLSPCGWLIVDGQGAALETDYEQLFHAGMGALAGQKWGSEPYFQELNISVSHPAKDEDLGVGDEVLSLSEALHEDFYFSALEYFGRLSGRPQGDRHLQPGQIVPEIRRGAPSIRIELRDYDRTSLSNHEEVLETASRALSQVQISRKLRSLGGELFTATSVAGRPIEATFVQGTDRGVILSGGQHANETTSPVGMLRAAKRLREKPGAHFTLCPVENPDGYALHQRLIRDNPRHMHHAARYTALGDDLEYRKGPKLYEKAIRVAAEARIEALLHLNFHGYPAHEWTRPLSGYIPKGFETWTIPKGFFLILRHRAGWAKAARHLMEEVTTSLNAVPGLRARNEAQIALFEAHAGGTGFEILNGFPVMISEDTRHRVPMTLITEYPDETLYGDAFREGHEAQMATVLAGYEALQNLPEALFPQTEEGAIA